ncbi:MAG: hypothetical protein GX090_00770 [Firmicutes bacterium]|nr:hypothetical protein [Bacillota bacterium]HOB34276.1 hypothetical protein [Bacillota bacterium]HPZ89986.1 hypothetical protein [Bacillota bacterium]HQE01393.1 hypothetical protein [Bacillota bacterium]
MLYNLLHAAVLLALLVKAFTSIMSVLSASPLWFNSSGISSGATVILGIVWAAVFLRGDNFAKIPAWAKILLPAAAVLAVVSIIISV